MKTTQNHPLFQQYPLSGKETISTGSVRTPYHIYDGYATFIGGTANLSGVSKLLSEQQVAPVETTTGRALMGVWIVDAADASLGSHQEIQVSFFVSRQPISPVQPHPFAILKLLLYNSEVKMMAHGLWNDSDKAVAYNRELLGLDASLMQGEIKHESELERLTFHGFQAGELLLQGSVHKANRPPINVIMPAIKAFGVGNFIRNLSLPILSVGVINPITDVLSENRIAQTYTKNDAMLLQFFDSATDSLEFGDGPYKNLDFKPDFVEHMTGFKFVYLNPQPWK